MTAPILTLPKRQLLRVLLVDRAIDLAIAQRHTLKDCLDFAKDAERWITEDEAVETFTQIDPEFALKLQQFFDAAEKDGGRIVPISTQSAERIPVPAAEAGAAAGTLRSPEASAIDSCTAVYSDVQGAAGNKPGLKSINKSPEIPEVGEAAPAVTTTAESDGGDHVSEPRQNDCRAAGALNGQQQPAPAAEIPERKPHGWWKTEGKYQLQRCADARMTMREAAVELKCSHSYLITQAKQYRIHFHGRAGRKLGDKTAADNLPARREPFRRFTGKPDLDPENVQPLAEDHPAIIENRTLFPSMVKDAADVERVLVSGAHSVKLGDRINKGAWAGMPLYTLTLEERKTCPSSCYHYRSCYGNGTPFARRHVVNDALMAAIERDLVILDREHPKGFVVRLHALGDFSSPAYLSDWREFLDRFPRLHVFGYTAHDPMGVIGKGIININARYSERWFIRFSVPQPIRGGTTTIWRKPEADRVPEGIVCPAQTKKTACCASCGLCWEPNARNETIVFVAHGQARGRKPAVTPPATVAANRAAAKKLPPDAPMISAPKAEPEETRDRFAKPVQRRCATSACGAMFTASQAEQIHCPMCVGRRAGAKPLPHDLSRRSGMGKWS